MASIRYLKVVGWTANDILTFRPDWTEEKAWQWLDDNESSIAEQLRNLGWGIIESLLRSEGNHVAS